MAKIELDRLGKRFGDVEVLSDMSLAIEDGTIAAFLGPSGCGKSTTLFILAGLYQPTSGDVRFDGASMVGVHPKDRKVGLVFQSYALYPHLTVYDNIAFGLRMQKIPKDEIKRRVKDAADVLGLEPFLDRKPRALSGGQRQRVAMGRAIVREPQAFLMDEPLSNLDAKLRVQMRAEIARLQNDLGVTTVYVTHDQVEAMTMGDRVAVMRKGEIQQVDGPQDLYDRPVNLFVGGFIGSPAMNMIEATLERANGGLAATTGSQRIALGAETLNARPGLRAFEGKKVVLGIRPEDLEDAALEPDTPQDQRMRGKIVLREALGAEIMAHFVVDARLAMTEDVKELARDVGDERLAEGGGTDEATLVGRFGARSRVREGEEAEVAVDTRALHFFDPESGLGIYDQQTKGAA